MAIIKKIILSSPFSIADKIENNNDSFRGSSFSLLQLPIPGELYQQLKTWENPDWLDEQLDRYEEEVKLN